MGWFMMQRNDWSRLHNYGTSSKILIVVCVCVCLSRQTSTKAKETWTLSKTLWTTSWRLPSPRRKRKIRARNKKEMRSPPTSQPKRRSRWVWPTNVSHAVGGIFMDLQSATVFSRRQNVFEKLQKHYNSYVRTAFIGNLFRMSGCEGGRRRSLYGTVRPPMFHRGGPNIWQPCLPAFK